MNETSLLLLLLLLLVGINAQLEKLYFANTFSNYRLISLSLPYASADNIQQFYVTKSMYLYAPISNKDWELQISNLQTQSSSFSTICRVGGGQISNSVTTYPNSSETNWFSISEKKSAATIVENCNIARSINFVPSSIVAISNGLLFLSSNRIQLWRANDFSLQKPSLSNLNNILTSTSFSNIRNGISAFIKTNTTSLSMGQEYIFLVQASPPSILILKPSSLQLVSSISIQNYLAQPNTIAFFQEVGLFLVGDFNGRNFIIIDSNGVLWYDFSLSSESKVTSLFFETNSRQLFLWNQYLQQQHQLLLFNLTNLIEYIKFNPLSSSLISNVDSTNRNVSQSATNSKLFQLHFNNIHLVPNQVNSTPISKVHFGSTLLFKDIFYAIHMSQSTKSSVTASLLHSDQSMFIAVKYQGQVKFPFVYQHFPSTEENSLLLFKTGIHWREDYIWSVDISSQLPFEAVSISHLLICNSQHITAIVNAGSYFFVVRLFITTGQIENIAYFDTYGIARDATCESINSVLIVTSKPALLRYNSTLVYSSSASTASTTMEYVKAKPVPPVIPTVPTIIFKNQSLFSIETADLYGVQFHFNKKWAFGTCNSLLCPISQTTGTYGYLYSDKYGILLQQANTTFTSLYVVNSNGDYIIGGYERLNSLQTKAVVFVGNSTVNFKLNFTNSVIGIGNSKILHVSLLSNGRQQYILYHQSNKHSLYQIHCTKNLICDATLFWFSESSLFSIEGIRYWDGSNLLLVFGSFTSESLFSISSDIDFLTTIDQSALIWLHPEFSNNSISVATCYGYAPWNIKSCSGNGICSSTGECTCINPNYFDFQQCMTPTCFGVSQIFSESCQSYGTCINFNQCQCRKDREGDQCEIYMNTRLGNCSDPFQQCNSVSNIPLFDTSSFTCQIDQFIKPTFLMQVISLDYSVNELTAFDSVVVKEQKSIIWFQNHEVWEKRQGENLLISSLSIDSIIVSVHHEQNSVFISANLKDGFVIKAIDYQTRQLKWNDKSFCGHSTCKLEKVIMTNEHLLLVGSISQHSTLTISTCIVESIPNYLKTWFVAKLDKNTGICHHIFSYLESLHQLQWINATNQIITSDETSIYGRDYGLNDVWKLQSNSIPLIGSDSKNILFLKVQTNQVTISQVNSNFKSSYPLIEVIFNATEYQCSSLQSNNNGSLTVLCEGVGIERITVHLINGIEKVYSIDKSNRLFVWIIVSLQTQTIQVYTVDSVILDCKATSNVQYATLTCFGKQMLVQNMNAKQTVYSSTISNFELIQLQFEFFSCETCSNFEKSNGVYCVNCIEHPFSTECQELYGSNLSSSSISLIILGTLCGICLLISFALIFGIAITIGILIHTKYIKTKKQKTDYELQNMFPFAFSDVKAMKEKVVSFKIDSSLFIIPFSDLSNLKEIGKGAFGTVYKCEYNRTTVAVKIFSCYDTFSNQQDFSILEREITILGSLRHPHIVAFVGASLHLPWVGIVTEFCDGGTLFDYIQKNRNNIPWKTKIQFLIDICKGFVYLHHHKIIHRDLKSENILLSSNCNSNIDSGYSAKLSDFGTSRKTNQNERMTKYIGTSFYIAPEIVLGLDYDTSADVFSFGIVMFELLIEESNPYLYCKKVQPTQLYIETEVARDATIRPELPKSFDLTKENLWYLELCQQCWQHEPSVRPAFTTILDILQKLA